MTEKQGIEPSELIKSLRLMEIKPDTSYIMYAGNVDFIPSVEQLEHLAEMAVPLFKERNSKVLIVAGPSVNIEEEKPVIRLVEE